MVFFLLQGIWKVYSYRSSKKTGKVSNLKKNVHKYSKETQTKPIYLQITSMFNSVALEKNKANIICTFPIDSLLE